MERQLDDPGAVAQVDEDHAAVVAPAVDPAGHAHVLTHARGIQLPGPGVAVQVGAWWSHKRSPDVVHDGFGRDELVLATVAIAKLDAFVAEDGNVAGAAARGLLELALEAAPGEFESCRVARAARVGGELERRRPCAPARRRRRGRRRLRPAAAAWTPSASARPRRPSPCRACAGRRSPRPGRRSDRRRRACSAPLPARRTGTRTACACSSRARARASCRPCRPGRRPAAGPGPRRSGRGPPAGGGRSAAAPWPSPAAWARAWRRTRAAG